MKPCNQLIQEVYKLTRQMIILADKGQISAEDDGCRLLYSVLQDCAYKIKMEAEREKASHISKGKWESC